MRAQAIIGVVILAGVLGAGLPVQAGEPARAESYMIATANRHASEAGLAMLRRGGSAVDAAIAAQMVLNLVEPQSSGIGGGAFLLAYDAEARAVHAYDGRETAPAAVTPGLFLKGRRQAHEVLRRGHWPAGRWACPALSPCSSWPTGAMAGCPGPRCSNRPSPWPNKASRCRTGCTSLIADSKGVGRFDAARAYFFTAEGAPKPVGTRLVNPAFAASLRTIASGGARAFYEGDIAAAMVAAIAGAEAIAGS